MWFWRLSGMALALAGGAAGQDLASEVRLLARVKACGRWIRFGWKSCTAITGNGMVGPGSGA